MLVGSTASGSGAYNLNGTGQITGYHEDIGIGSFTQSGGTNSFDILSVGVWPGVTGTYSLSGSGQLSMYWEHIGVGFGGLGLFTQSGGTNSVVGDLLLGFDVGSSGTYSLSGSGLLYAGDIEKIGVVGSGALTQSGGTSSAGFQIGVGYNAGSTGTYTLTNSGLVSAPNEYVGYFGSGSFMQSGGTNAATTALSVGDQPGGSGSYTLSGSGQLSAPTEYIGNSGSGSFTQSGGTNSSFELDVGDGPDSSGSYCLSSSGLLTTLSFESIGTDGSGSFTQSGGTNSLDNLFIGASADGRGTYNLTGSGLLSAPTEYIGDSGSGSFTQSGGTNSVGGLVLAVASSSLGTYNLTDGLLILAGSTGLTQGAGFATFNFSGGTIQTGAGFTSNVPMVFNVSGGIATFDTQGNTVTLADPLSGPGGLNKAGAGMLILATSESYTGPTSVSGGTLELLADNTSSSFTANSGGILLFNSATLNLNTRSVRASTGGTVQYQNATINGGFLRGPGTHVALAGSSNTFNAVTTYDTTNFQQNGPTTLSNFNNGGQIANNAPLIWDGGINNGGADLVVNSSVSTNDWTNAGVVTVNHGGALNNHLGDATSFGGARIYVNSGGTLRADSQGEGVTLDLQDSLLVNNGFETGTVNAYYGATVSGSGSFGPINVLQAGMVAIAPSASPIAPSFNVSSGSIAGAGQSAVPTTVHSAYLVAPNPADVLVLSGNLSGDGLLDKLGAGTVVLTGIGGFGGTVLVAAGTLVLDNSATVADGANLTVGSGFSAFGATVPASDAAQITPVPEPGTLALFGVVLCGAAAYRRLRSRRKKQ